MKSVAMWRYQKEVNDGHHQDKKAMGIGKGKVVSRNFTG